MAIISFLGVFCIRIRDVSMLLCGYNGMLVRFNVYITCARISVNEWQKNFIFVYICMYIYVCMYIHVYVCRTLMYHRCMGNIIVAI